MKGYSVKPKRKVMILREQKDNEGVSVYWPGSGGRTLTTFPPQKREPPPNRASTSIPLTSCDMSTGEGGVFSGAVWEERMAGESVF